MKEKILMLCCILFATVYTTKAQVTIGASEAPEKYATLQVKDKTEASLDAVTSEKGGLLLPRVELKKKKELLPFATQAEVNANEQAYKDAKLSHTGLIVYNLVENDAEELCLGLNQWDGEQWNCFQVKKGNAVIDNIFCDEIRIYGNYVQGVQTTPQEYIVVPVNVTKAGAYTFTVNAMYDASTMNGYSFTGSGEFLFTGKQLVTLTAQGKPSQIHFDANNAAVGDYLDIFYNGKNEASLQCPSVVIPVAPPLADFSLYCGSAKVFGIYTVLPDQTNSDDNTHYIEMDVEVIGVTAGGGWSATTDKQNGLSFRGSGTFTTTGRQKIRLYAEAGSRANTYEPIVLTLSAQTLAGTTSCKVTVRPAFTRKKIAAYGSTSGYGYSAYRGAAAGFLKSNKNFGNADDSTVKMVATNTPIANATDGNWVDYNAFIYKHVSSDISDSNFEDLMAENPDIIIIGYAASWPSGTDANDALPLALKYLNKGGIIIEFSESTGATRILNTIFGTSGVNRVTNDNVTSNSSLTNINSIETILPSLVDPILEGPFQPTIDGEVTTTLGGLRIAGDTEERLYGIENVPTSGIISYGYGTEYTNAPVCFRTIGQRYLYFGDGGYLTNDDNGSWLSDLTEPFATSTDGTYRPIMRPNANSYTNVANSYFFGNVLAWAIEQAQYYGINAK
ncbi:MAG: hypothetical protein ACK5KL_19685 [Dysgonomonas sp.]